MGGPPRVDCCKVTSLAKAIAGGTRYSLFDYIEPAGHVRLVGAEVGRRKSRYLRGLWLELESILAELVNQGSAALNRESKKFNFCYNSDYTRPPWEGVPKCENYQ